MQVFQSDVSSTQSEGMFAPAAKPRRKNDGAAAPLQQACPLRDAEGALSFWVTPCTQASGLAPVFPQKESPALSCGACWVGG